MNKWISIALIATIFLVSCNKEDHSNDQITKEISAIDTYLATITNKYVVYDAYGNRIAISKFGDGPPPHAGQTMKVTYTGRLFNDSSVVFSSGVIDKLENITVPGLKIGVSALAKGSVATLYLPSANAFGATGSGLVPANTTVRYDVSIDTVYRTADELSRFKIDSAAIRMYLDTIPVNATYHSSGIYYTIDAQGTGDKPKPFDAISFHYKLVLMSNGSLLQDSDLTSNLFGLIDGLKVGIPLMKEGGKATFYVPSGLAYGPTGSGTGSGSVPANANLIFTIQLNTIN